jgi:hypothetical protein
MREAIDRLQELLEAPAEDTMGRYYRRRRELLARIYASGGLDRRMLFALLDEHKTPHQWIGQQVKSGYLEKYPHPSGRDLYAVTHRAVQDLGLHTEAQAVASLLDQAQTADWESQEDAAYDKL